MAIEPSIMQVFEKQAEKFNEGQDQEMRAKVGFSELDSGRYASYSSGLISLLKPGRLSHLLKVVHGERSLFPVSLRILDREEQMIVSPDYLTSKIEEILRSELVKEEIRKLLQ
ncbi:MAG: hypothetical protein V7641_2182 [Blastocatellia bacterium]